MPSTIVTARSAICRRETEDDRASRYIADMSLRTFFSAGPVDRNPAVRGDTAALAALLEHSATRFIAVWQSRCMIADDAPVLLERSALGAAWNPERAIYLGTLATRHVFAVALDDPAKGGPDATAFDNHGRLLAMNSEADGALLAYAKGMVEWQQRHLHCGLCGSLNRPESGGFVMACTSSACGHRCFPRVDPAIIVLATRGDACLLGRQTSWPEGRFSTIAGFVEPGESMEDAVRREVAEETDIRIGAVEYLGSQPWPFPGAMMVGFHAEALSSAIHLNDAELAEAGWFTREQLAAGSVHLPPKNSIAFRLIEAWFDRWDGPPLDSLNLSSSFSRSARAD